MSQAHQSQTRAQKRVRVLLKKGKFEKALKVLSQMINRVSVNGQVASANDQVFLALALSECCCYIKRNCDKYSTVCALLNNLTQQIYVNGDISVDLKRYILYKQHIAAFELHDEDTKNSTFSYVN